MWGYLFIKLEYAFLFLKELDFIQKSNITPNGIYDVAKSNEVFHEMKKKTPK